MKRKLLKVIIEVLPILFLIGLVVAFYWKFFFRGLIPFPGDLLVGAYFPWLDYKWGNIVGVAIKNPLISDVFSQFFLWKAEAARCLSQGVWPLWNPYSYSGFPLLASFNYGALNPFNLLMEIFGKNSGWSWLVMIQTFGACISMFLFLKSLKRETVSALIGAVVYGFGGFAMVRSQFVNVGYSLLYLPIALTLIENTFSDKRGWRLLFITPLIFLIVVSGHFQSMVYSGILIAGYYIYRIGLRNGKLNFQFLLSLLFGLGLSLIQLLPTLELMNHSVRFEEGFIKSVNYGLLPVRNLITLIAPDFFGNPSTNNYWGFSNYHETIAYAGVIGFIALIFGVFHFKKLGVGKFFLLAAIIALCLQFDTPLGKLIYTLKVPFLWTSAAGRVNFVFLFSVSVLVSEMFDKINLLKISEKLRLAVLPLLLLLTSAGITVFCIRMFSQSGYVQVFQPQINDLNVGIRNLALPLLLTVATMFVLIVSQKFILWKYVVLLLVLADLFRFGWKYIPLVPEKYMFPSTEVIDFIKNDVSIFRVDREVGEILPPNTWAGYGLMSPSGYDPLAVNEYVRAYNKDLNGVSNGGVSRYSELERIDAESLGKYNVKYLLTIKRDINGVIPGSLINKKINQGDWINVFETSSIAVLQNKKYQERVRIVDSKGNSVKGTANITSYENNKVIINFENVSGDKLLLADTYYPGWEATINGNQTKIGDEIKPFRSIDIRGIKTGEVVFEYKPSSFRIGLYISFISISIWFFLLLLIKRNEK